MNISKLLQNRTSVITIYDSSDYYRSRQQVITIYDRYVITNHDNCYYNLPQVLQFKTLLQLATIRTCRFVSSSFSRTTKGIRDLKQRDILVSRGRDPYGQHQGSRPLASSTTGSGRFTDSLVRSGKSYWLNMEKKYSALLKISALARGLEFWS